MTSTFTSPFTMTSNFFSPTKASAACSRGLIQSHIDSPLPAALLATTTLGRRILASDNPTALTNPQSPLLGYIPTPIQSPVFSPIRSPYSPRGPFPPTPPTPPTRLFISPIQGSIGAHERRRESRLDHRIISPTTSLLAAKGIIREVTPKPRSLCPECEKVKMMLPAKWCGHQVTPSRMKDGLRVVRINRDFRKTTTGKAPKPKLKIRRNRRTGQGKAKPVANDLFVAEAKSTTPAIHDPLLNVTEPTKLVFDDSSPEFVKSVDPFIDDPFVDDTEPARLIVNSPTVKTSTPERVASSYVDETTPKSSRSCSLTVDTPSTHTPSIQTPFRNPDLNDQPLRWSPGMFRPNVDRHNFTWSDWDSPSREIEDVTYDTTNWPVHDPFAGYPPEIRKRIREILANPAGLAPAPISAPGIDSVAADSVHHELPDSMESFSSYESRSDFSSWVKIDARPWPTCMLQMWINGEKDRERDRERDQARNAYRLSDDTSTVSTLSTNELLELDAEMDAGKGLEENQAVDQVGRNRSTQSQSLDMSSFLQLYIDSDKDRKRYNGEDKETRSSSSDNLSIPPRPNAPTPSGFRAEVAIPESPEDLFIPPRPNAPTPSGFRAEVAIPESPEPTTSQSAESARSESPEYSSWVDIDVRKWSDHTFNFYTRQEAERQRRAGEDITTSTGSSDLSSDSESLSAILGRNIGTKLMRNTQQHFNSLRTSRPPSVGAASAIVEKAHDDYAAASLLKPPSSSSGSESSYSPGYNYEHFCAKRSLPSAVAMEPREQREVEVPRRENGLDWKSVACIAVAAAALGAGLAYAWFSG
ncbi:hypothetical protein F4804DRAFT_25646 [Jackrogersella minutella]|nr:hypothetical protein F4804DRAFT_25646 [Jackrogersella minutella]